MLNKLFFPQEKEKLDFPAVLDIELTNNCNFKCLMCPSGTKLHKRPQGMMEEALFVQILNEIKGRKTPLRFIRWGEPTLHPELINYIEKARQLGIPCHLNSNGSFLFTDLAEKLVQNLDSIKFSFQGIDRESYREMRNVDFFDDLVRGIESFYKLRKKNKKPFIGISSSITYETDEQVRAFKEIANRISDEVTVSRTVLEHIDPEQAQLTEVERTKLIWLKKRESVVKSTPDCSDVFSVLAINYDGSVSACCRDYDNQMLAGNLAESSLESIWSGDEMRRYRQMIVDGKYSMLPLCQHCFASSIIPD